MEDCSFDFTKSSRTDALKDVGGVYKRPCIELANGNNECCKQTYCTSGNFVRVYVIDSDESSEDALLQGILKVDFTINRSLSASEAKMTYAGCSAQSNHERNAIQKKSLIYKPVRKFSAKGYT